MRRADFFDFRKVFLLLIGTVCVPALALSTFGILAIKHERAAVEKRLEELYGDKLDKLAAALAGEMATPGADTTEEALARRIPALTEQLFPEERAHFELLRVESGESDTVTALLRSIASSAPAVAADLGPVFIERPLGGALAGNSLVVRLPGSDSPASIALGNRVLYGVLLALFYGAIAVGVVLTSRAVYREAKLSRLKSDFVSHVSHELRTPLTSVRLFVETLRMGRVRSEAEREECLEHLDKEAERLAGLVDRLLDWARMESGRKVYRKVEVEAGQVAREALAVFERQHLAREGLVQLAVDDDAGAIEADREALSMVLFNLLVNAWKYTGTEKEIRLEVRRLGRRVAFDVLDNGPGIPKSERKRIFEQFYRVDDLLTRRTEGTGLGLAIAKRIVEDHGGRVDLGSGPAGGSRFRVILDGVKERAA